MKTQNRFVPVHKFIVYRHVETGRFVSYEFYVQRPDLVLMELLPKRGHGKTAQT